MNKKQYLAKQKLKSKIKNEQAQKKTGKLLSTRELGKARTIRLHELFNFAPHNNTMFCEPINKGNRR